jgi:hypothetical protein
LNSVELRDPRAVESARLDDPLAGAEGMRFGLESVQGAGPTLRTTEALFARPYQRAAELAGVGALVLPAPKGAARPWMIEPFATGLPRALLVPEAIVVPPEAAISAALSPRIDPRRTAVLEEGDPMPPTERPFSGRVRFESRRPAAVSLAADSPSPSILVLFDSYERGWQATVDGEPARLLRADGAFQGVRLSAGRHSIRLAYTPPLLREACGLAVVGLLGLWLAARRLPRRSAPASP